MLLKICGVLHYTTIFFLTFKIHFNMKKALPFFLCFMTFTSFGQLTSSFHYSLSLPQGAMAKNINAIHQGVLSVGYRLPKALQFVRVGADLGYGGYANVSVPVELQFDNSPPTKTSIQYSSNVAAANAFLQLDLFKKGLFTPYVLVKSGVQDFHSSIYVADPADTDACRPLENESVLSDQTFTHSFGGGLRLQLPTPNYSSRIRQHYFDFQVVSTRGGSLDYINTKKLTDHSQHNQLQQVTGEESKPVEMRFINITSNVVHAHKVAEVFNSRLRLLDINVGYYAQF
jgi:hypothetical protein